MPIVPMPKRLVQLCFYFYFVYLLLTIVPFKKVVANV